MSLPTPTTYSLFIICVFVSKMVSINCDLVFFDFWDLHKDIVMPVVFSNADNTSQLLPGNVIINLSTFSVHGAFGHAAIVLSGGTSNDAGYIVEAPRIIHATNDGVVNTQVMMKTGAPVFRPIGDGGRGAEVAIAIALTNARLFVSEGQSGAVRHRSKGVKSFFSMLNPGGSKNMEKSDARIQKLQSGSGVSKYVQCSEFVVLCYQLNALPVSLLYIPLNAEQASPKNLREFFTTSPMWQNIGVVGRS